MPHLEVGLYQFLVDSELQQYYNSFKNDLKIQNVAQLKWVTGEDLISLGMSKPEIRRLKKSCSKFANSGYFSRVCDLILGRKEGTLALSKGGICRSLEGPLPTDQVLTVESPSTKHIIPIDAIVINKELGSGEFGVVRQGVWSSEDGHLRQVAIKCVSQQRMQANPTEFLKEATILHSIEHDHIVRLYGVVLESSTMMLVTELAPLRSLLECLKEPTVRASFSVVTLCDFSLQICGGMCYLESKRLIHRDLAARNILVFSKNSVKISDFGLSRMLGVGKDYYQTNFNVNLKLPIAWCAPECINYLRFTTASDVWAFGVTLWEMFSYGFQPWPALTGQQILEAIDEPNQQRLERPDSCPLLYYQLMLNCWRHVPEQRPKFTQLLQQLSECRPEQVMAVQPATARSSGADSGRQRVLQCSVGEVVTVLDKRGHHQHNRPALWKVVNAAGRTGYIDPAQFVALIGNSASAAGDCGGERFKSTLGRRETRSSLCTIRRRLTPQMISKPQDDFKRTGHMGPDGKLFGSLPLLGARNGCEEIYSGATETPDDVRMDIRKARGDSSDRAPLLSKTSDCITKIGAVPTSDQQQKQQRKAKDFRSTDNATKHEYHEISSSADGDVQSRESMVHDSSLADGAVASSADLFDLGPSLMDEVLSVLSANDDNRSSSGDVFDESSATGVCCPKPRGRILSDESASGGEISNMCNEIREQGAKYRHEQQTALNSVFTGRISKCKERRLREISESDRRTLEQAIAMANELAAKSMAALNAIDANETSRPLSATSTSTNKFAFRLRNSAMSCSPSAPERRNFSSEAATIADIQSSLCESERRVYDALVTEPVVRALSSSGNVPVLAVAPNRCKGKTKGALKCDVKQSLHGLISDNRHSDRSDTGASINVERFSNGRLHSWPCRTMSVDRDLSDTSAERNGGTGAFLQSEKADEPTSVANPLPLPPRHRVRADSETTAYSKVAPNAKEMRRHERKHPLVIPTCSTTAQPAAIVLSTSKSTDRVGVVAGVETLADKSPVGRRTPPPKPPRSGLSSSASSRSNIRADDSEMFRQLAERRAEHVSCEDLLDFAADRPNWRRTRGPSHGIDSDEVRIMLKVLGRVAALNSDRCDQEETVDEPVTAAERKACVDALNCTDWDVHHAIKLRQVQLALGQCDTDSPDSAVANVTPVSASQIVSTLQRLDWNVQRSVAALMVVHGSTGHATVV